MTYGQSIFSHLNSRALSSEARFYRSYSSLFKNKIVRVVDLIIVQKDEDGKQPGVRVAAARYRGGAYLRSAGVRNHGHHTG